MTGGSDVEFSPPTFFMQQALQPLLERMGVVFDYQVNSYGFGAVGGGEVVLSANTIENIQPIELLDKGTIVEILGEILVGTGTQNKKGPKYNEQAGQVVANAARALLPTANITVKVVNHQSKTLMGSLVARTDTGCVFHHSSLTTANKVNWEQVGTKLARGLSRQIEMDA